MTRVFETNIIAYDGKVVFAQGTGSITMLDLETGAVLLRKRPVAGVRFDGGLRHTEHGLLMVGYSRVTMLHEDTLDVLWATDASGAAVGSRRFISHDGYETVSCNDIETGARLWSRNMPEGWDLQAVGDKGLVGRPRMRGMGPVTVVDLSNGKDLLHLDYLEEGLRLKTYFDGSSVYLLTASLEREMKHGQAIPKLLIEFDLQKRRKRSVDFQSEKVVSYSAWGFYWDEKFFGHDGSVRPVFPHEPFDRDDFEAGPGFVAASIEAGIFVMKVVQTVDREDAYIFEIQGSDKRWLGSSLWEPWPEQAGDKLLFSSPAGRLECVDLETGRPEWIYAFPVARWFPRVSGIGFLNGRSRIYQNEIESLPLARGMTRMPMDQPLNEIQIVPSMDNLEYEGRVIVDPQPDPRFRRLLIKRVLIAAGMFLFPIMMARGKRSRVNPELSGGRGKPSVRILGWCVLLSAGPLVCLVHYGRADPYVTGAILFAYAVCLTVRFRSSLGMRPFGL
jgi:hypothetical protein